MNYAELISVIRAADMTLPLRLIESFVKSNQENTTDSISRGFVVPPFATEESHGLGEM